MKFPYKASTDSQLVNEAFNQNFENLLSISIANYGDKEVTLNVNGVMRTLPAGNVAPNVPTYSFGFSCEGIPFDIQIELLFPNGNSNVIIDKSTLKNC
jgi:hypothetical protein